MIGATIGRAQNRSQTLDLEVQELQLTEALKGVQQQSQQLAQNGQAGAGNPQLAGLQQQAKQIELELAKVRALKKSAETLYETWAQAEKKEIETTFKNIYA